ncbi:hypothetical protein RGQ29_015279 [Quercus rubra]|uniref:Uncharacterized protein n=1 Tax=Quercus rubra TaxID=3512 RepID=A0AAN7J2Z5_QUERU|nr:hypothetical protein RGQ29_015279 [Quercus rubra]
MSAALLNCHTTKSPTQLQKILLIVYIESDCEDFFSVSGDTTPSRGNTPIHHCSFKETHHLEKPLYMDSSSNPILEPSKTDMKKQIIELFQESFRDDAIDDSQNLQERENDFTGGQVRLRSKGSLCCVTAARLVFPSIPSFSIEAIPNRNYNPGKGKFAKSARCCLPNLMLSLSFSGRRKWLSLDGP